MAVRGVPSTEWDLIKIIITTAGTFTVGSASTVKYTSYTGNDTGLKISETQSATIIDGSFQPVGHGMEVRMAPGVYSSNDEWELEALRETVEEMKKFQRNGYSDEGRFKTFKRYWGKRSRARRKAK